MNMQSSISLIQSQTGNKMTDSGIGFSTFFGIKSKFKVDITSIHIIFKVNVTRTDVMFKSTFAKIEVIGKSS